MIDKLFFIIYHSYYRKGNYKNDIPPLTVDGIFTISCFGIIISCKALYERGINIPAQKMEKPMVLLVLFCTAIVVYLFFFFKRRYIKIYQKYVDDKFLSSKMAKIIGFYCNLRDVLNDNYSTFKE